MAKFKVKFEFTGVKLEIEGERQDISLISQGVGQQIAGLFQPAADIVDGNAPETKRVENTAGVPQVVVVPRKRKSPRRSDSSTKVPGQVVQDAAPTLTHDAEKFGFPDQAWGGIEKAVWLLYVVNEQVGAKDLSSIQMAALYTQHFREAKAPDASHFTTYLSRAKKRTPPPVADTNANGSQRWYLTTAGKELGRKLVVARVQASAMFQQANVTA